jgi:hypothetical protein
MIIGLEGGADSPQGPRSLLVSSLLTELSVARFFEQHTRVPSMRDVRGPIEPIPILTGAQDMVGSSYSGQGDKLLIDLAEANTRERERVPVASKGSRRPPGIAQLAAPDVPACAATAVRELRR